MNILIKDSTNSILLTQEVQKEMTDSSLTPNLFIMVKIILFGDSTSYICLGNGKV